MPFIGQQPVTGAYHKLDSITTSATATYNLQLNGGAYSPASANHLLVSLNGVMQAPQDSFTVSGSQITFSSALTSSDSIDFIMALGDVLNIGTPSDGSVNTNQLVNSAVTDAKIAGMSSSKLTGALPALDGSALTGISTSPYGVYGIGYQSGTTLIGTTFGTVDITSSYASNGTTVSTANNRIELTEAGVYYIDIIGYANHAANSGAYTPGMRILKNGGTSLQIHYNIVNYTGSHSALYQCRTVQSLAATDTVNFQVYSNCSATGTLYDTVMSVIRIG